MIDPEKIRELIFSFEAAAAEADTSYAEGVTGNADYDSGSADTYRVCARKLRELVEH